MNQKTFYTWHISDGTLAYGDSRQIVPGMALACKPEQIEMCVYGLHSSPTILDALSWKNGNVLSFCEVGGRCIEEETKIVSSQRRHLAVADVSHTFHEFACWCAEQALALINNPDPRLFAAVEAKRAWLRGEIDDNQLAAARVAARAAAWPAPWAAARAAQEKHLQEMLVQLPEFQPYKELILS